MAATAPPLASRILVAEDDPAQAAVICDLLEADAFPEAARRKLEAIRRATIRIRDVVRRLEDIEDRSVEYMPGMQMTDLSGDGPPGPEKPR